MSRDGRQIPKEEPGNRKTPPELISIELEETFMESQESFPFTGWEHYEFLKFIGAGGMGKVFLARDTQLGRSVALKLIRSDDSEVAQRFLQEARIQARVDHPHICRVYEVGEVQGYHYIAMQFIDGRSLKESAVQMSLEQKIKVIKQVAEALHAAHRTGLIHRDIKPGNIMVELSEEGWVPYILDFGLAREINARGLTVTGAIVGTPTYMSPEQAKGEIRQLDRRTDLYSMGATIYELLSDKPPFEAETAIEVLMKVIQEEPVPLGKRSPNIPVDLETIVMKCLEKEPQRRYDSARALADDLQRYLDGEAILARPANLTYRLRIKAKKHKEVVFTILLALIILIAVGFVALRSYWEVARREAVAKEQAGIAQRYGQLVKEIEAILRYSHLLPLHNTDKEKALVRERMKQISEEMKQFGTVGESPGNYALGRGYLALGEYQHASRLLQSAWQKGYQGAEVAYALGQAFGALYQKALADSQRIVSKDLRESHRKKAEKQYRDPALQYLKAGSSVTAESSAYVEGLIAFYEENYDKSLQMAHDAFQQVPWLYEAKKLEADVLQAIGYVHHMKGEREEGAKFYRRAGQSYQTAAGLGESDDSIYEWECNLYVRWMDLDRIQGNSPDTSFEKALAACDKALQANPESAQAYGKKSLAYLVLSEHEIKTGEDPTISFRKSIELGKQVVRIDPTDYQTYGVIGSVYWNEAEYKVGHGMNPLSSLDEAIQSFEQAIRLNPNFSSSYNTLGNVFCTRARFEMTQGLDPRPSLEEARKSLQKSIEIDPKRTWPHVNLGIVYANLGEFALNSGVDSRSYDESAIQSYRRALQLNPNFPSAYNNIGDILKRKGVMMMTLGTDPIGVFQEARESFQQAIRLNSANYIYHLGIGGVDTKEAEWAIKQNQPARKFLENAERSLSKALELNPEEADNHSAMAELFLRKAELLIAQKQTPQSEIRKGQKHLARALKINSRSASTLAIRGALSVVESGSVTASQRKQLLQKAKADLEKAFQIEPALKLQYASYMKSL